MAIVELEANVITDMRVIETICVVNELNVLFQLLFVSCKAEK
jgi:hypothetical protein